MTASALCQTDGARAYEAFQTRRSEPAHANLQCDEAIEKYHAKLTAESTSDGDAAKTIRIITARGEGAFYDGIYSKPPKFQTLSSALLAEAIRNRPPGKALDVDMGQGRNSICLARHGWNVTGFDVSRAGLAEAARLAASAGVHIKTFSLPMRNLISGATGGT